MAHALAMPAMLALPMVAIFLALPVGGEAGGLRVTTDGAEYCAALSERAEGLRNPPPSSVTLAEEGRRLCATGHVRTGIAKLRRAIRAAQTDGRSAG